MNAVASGSVSVADLVTAVRRDQQHRRTVTTQRGCTRSHGAESQRPVGVWLGVTSAQAGAGATTVALAITEALVRNGQRVRLIDRAPSADAFASIVQEIDSGRRGQRAGRRRGAIVIRPSGPLADVTTFDGVNVEDAEVPQTTRRVVAVRPSVPGLARAERALEPTDVLAVVGVSRWPRSVFAAAGPLVQRAYAEGRVVFFPQDRELALHGPTTAPLPVQLREAGRRAAVLALPQLDRAPDALTTAETAAPHRSRRWIQWIGASR